LAVEPALLWAGSVQSGAAAGRQLGKDLRTPYGSSNAIQNLLQNHNIPTTTSAPVDPEEGYLLGGASDGLRMQGNYGSFYSNPGAATTVIGAPGYPPESAKAQSLLNDPAFRTNTENRITQYQNDRIFGNKCLRTDPTTGKCVEWSGSQQIIKNAIERKYGECTKTVVDVEGTGYEEMIECEEPFNVVQRQCTQQSTLYVRPPEIHEGVMCEDLGPITPMTDQISAVCHNEIEWAKMISTTRTYDPLGSVSNLWTAGYDGDMLGCFPPSDRQEYEFSVSRCPDANLLGQRLEMDNEGNPVNVPPGAEVCWSTEQEEYTGFYIPYTCKPIEDSCDPRIKPYEMQGNSLWGGASGPLYCDTERPWGGCPTQQVVEDVNKALCPYEENQPPVSLEDMPTISEPQPGARLVAIYDKYLGFTGYNDVVNGWALYWTEFEKQKVYIVPKRAIVERVFLLRDFTCDGHEMYESGTPDSRIWVDRMKPESACVPHRIEFCNQNMLGCKVVMDEGELTGEIYEPSEAEAYGQWWTYSLRLTGTQAFLNDTVDISAAGGVEKELTDVQKEYERYFQAATQSIVTWRHFYGGEGVKRTGKQIDEGGVNAWFARVTFDCHESDMKDCSEKILELQISELHGVSRGGWNCIYQGKTCRNEECDGYTHTYKCTGGGEVGIVDQKVSYNCLGDVQCMGNACIEDTDEGPNRDFNKAAVGAEIFNNIKADSDYTNSDEMDYTKIEIFPGEENTCKKRGWNNCCQANSTGVGLGNYIMAGREATELALATMWFIQGYMEFGTVLGASVNILTNAHAALVPVYNAVFGPAFAYGGQAMYLTTALTAVGILVAAASVTYFLLDLMWSCTEEDMKTVAKKQNGVCIFREAKTTGRSFGVKTEVTEYYCCYNGILSRMLHEQGNVMAWGSRWGNKCGGWTPDEMSRVNWDQINLDEYMQYVIHKTTLTVAEQTGLMETIKNQVNYSTRY